jgi:hypothetical protein
LLSLGPDGALSSSPQSGEFFLPPNHRKGAFLFHAIRKKRKRHSKKVTLIVDVPQVHHSRPFLFFLLLSILPFSFTHLA